MNERSSGNYPNISLQGMSTATGTLGELNMGALNVIPQLIYSLLIAANRPSVTPDTYEALSCDYNWTSKSIISLSCATIQNDFQVSHSGCVV